MISPVSKSTISKFVKQLGFEDYKEFKAEAYSRGKREVYIKDLNTINITDYILQKGTEEYLDVLFSDIRYLFFNTDSKKIDHLVTLIHDYEEVAAFGEGYSETAALNFQHKMSFYQKFIYTTTNDRKQVEYISHAKENTLLLIFSNSGRYISEYTHLTDAPSKKCFEETKAKVSFKNGIHVDDGKDKVDISFRNGIHVDSSDGAKVHIDRNGINVVDESGKQKVYTDENGHIYGDKDYKKNDKKNPAMEFPIWLVSVVAFFLFGFLDILGGWVTSWLWFLVIPLYYTTVKAIQKKKVNIFCYPVFITWIYLVLGFYANLWHPMWLLFLTIPLFYYIANIIDRKNHPQDDINIEQDGYSATVTTVEPQKESHIFRNTIIIVGSIFCAFLLILCVSSVFGQNGKFTRITKFDCTANDGVHTIDLKNGSGDVNFYKSPTDYSYVEYNCEYRGYFGSLNKDTKLTKYYKGFVNITANPNSGFCLFGYLNQTTNIYLADDVYYKYDKDWELSDVTVNSEDNWEVTPFMTVQNI